MAEQHIPSPAHPPSLDAAPLNPEDFDWVPVKRKPRDDGWTIERQRRFIATLADTGSVTLAATEVGMSSSSAYRLRRLPEGQGFATAWDIAIDNASRRLIDIAMDRVIHGSDEPVFDRDGNRVGRRVRYNDRLLMFMLRALQPERFRHANRATRDPREALPPPVPPVADALAALAPPTPADPAALMEPDTLADALFVAETGDGELPHWHRGTSDDPDDDASLV
ncbi:hypothetical protein NED98_15695 [Sphingomonas sp. MMSM20]|uniref:hypothetical protein n=1 Tax=Sphingomonas lycopersici TaxID=2951807 RepID=UPI002238EDB0|nr:hypothetical protein [Sphingomonas lycopersici]MCW6531691.1 hypothetical protein [Sphingomonas lycopersici]